MNKKPKAKARARVSMKARIAALDRAALVQRLQDVGEHQKAALFHRSTSDEINRLHGALHMPGLSGAAQAAIKDRGRALLDALDQSEKAMDVRNVATVRGGSTTRRLSHHLPGQSCSHKGKDA